MLSQSRPLSDHRALKCREVVKSSEHNLYTVTGHAVKNYLKDLGIEKTDDAQSAEAIYKIAQQSAKTADGKIIPHARLTLWTYKTDHKPPNRHTSVRPF